MARRDGDGALIYPDGHQLQRSFSDTTPFPPQAGIGAVLALDVLVDEGGQPREVRGAESPAPQLAELGTVVLMHTYVKRARCGGQYCALRVRLASAA